MEKVWIARCSECQRDFETKRIDQAKFCGGACRQKHYRKSHTSVTKKSTGGRCIRCGKGTQKGNSYCGLSCKALTNREKHSSTYRTIKNITGKGDYEVWMYCEEDWKRAYAMLEARNYRYSASLKTWQYIPHTVELPLEFQS